MPMHLALLDLPICSTAEFTLDINNRTLNVILQATPTAQETPRARRAT
jgi:hypothetical protein